MTKHDDLLDRVILTLSEKDKILARHLFQGGTGITGGLGAGKTSTSLKALCYGMLRAGFGGLICTIKDEDTETFLSYAKACGRGNDVVTFNIHGSKSFDPLAYLSSTGKRADDVESIIDFFSILLSIGKQHVGVNNDRFWELACEQSMRHAIHLLRLAKHPLSITAIYQTIQSFPNHPDEHESEAWQSSSFTASVIAAIRNRQHELTEVQWADLNVATEFVFKKWAGLDEKTTAVQISAERIEG